MSVTNHVADVIDLLNVLYILLCELARESIYKFFLYFSKL